MNLALFLSNYLSAHLKLLENDQNKDVLLNAHLYLVKISQVEEREVFKVCPLHSHDLLQPTDQITDLPRILVYPRVISLRRATIASSR